MGGKAIDAIGLDCFDLSGTETAGATNG